MVSLIPDTCSFCPSPLLSPLFPHTGSELLRFSHITEYNNDYTSCPAMPDQQEKVGFFPLHGGEGKLRPKESQVCPVPFSKAEFGGEKLESQEACWPISSSSPKLQLLWLPSGTLNETSFQKTQMNKGHLCARFSLPFLTLYGNEQKGIQKRGVLTCKEGTLGRTEGKLYVGCTLNGRNKEEMPNIGTPGKGILPPSMGNVPLPNGKYCVILQPHYVLSNTTRDSIHSHAHFFFTKASKK